MIDKDRFNKIVENKIGRLNSRALTWDYVFRQDPALQTQINKEEFVDVQDFYFKLNLAVIEYPMCPQCKVKHRKPKKEGSKFFFSDYCSAKCANSDKETKSAVNKHNQSRVNQTAAAEKRRQTMLLKYGASYNSQREDVKHILKKSKLSDTKLDLMMDREWFVENYSNGNHTLLSLQEETGIDKGTIHQYLRFHGLEGKQGYKTSRGQIEVKDWIQSLGFQCTLNDRSILGNRDIDVYIPSKKFGIEYDGLYYHSFDSIPPREVKLYHRQKVDDARKNGVFLIRITDYEWIYKKEIVQSMIQAKLGSSLVRVPARKCVLQIISESKAKEFLTKNHLQGYSPASISIGLFFNESLVQVVSFGKPRFQNQTDYELIRLASAIDTTVIGGFKKCLAYFKSNYKGSILTYADYRYSSGAIYEQCGFEFIHHTDPNYTWTDKTRLISRYESQKHKLSKLLKNFDATLTEHANMFNNGYRVYYDCGNLKFILR
jgi:hypothetical protein